MTLHKTENESLWEFVEKVFPYLEKDKSYRKLVQTKPFDMEIHQRIHSVLQQRTLDRRMEELKNEAYEN